MTETELRAIEERASKATAGPWGYIRLKPDRLPRKCETITQIIAATKIQPRSYGKTILRHEAQWLMNPLDRRFLTHARSDIPALVAEVRRLWAILASMQGVAPHSTLTAGREGDTVGN